MRAAIVAIMLVGCIESGEQVCPSGRICPPGDTCRVLTNPDAEICATPSQLGECKDQVDFTSCAMGRCYQQVCLPVACGNLRLDSADGEVCDDGNERSGDGCSSDCHSTETCGNGVADLVTGEGCDDGNRVSNDGCDGVCQLERPRWISLATQPRSRDSGAAVYDIARDRIVLFGGTGTGVANETWEATTAGWRMVAPLQAPSARITTMAYDAARHRTLLFGGDSDGGDTWLWDGTSWSAPGLFKMPDPRVGHAMAYDTHRQRVVLFGGQRIADLAGPSNETWEWNGEVWTHVTEVGTPPPERLGHAMTYDPSRGKIVMFGGTTVDRAVREYDGTWSSVEPNGPKPLPRVHAAMAYDPINRRVLLVGGTQYQSTTSLTDAWSWDGYHQVWTQIAAPTPFPVGTYSMVTDVRGGVVVLVGTPKDADSEQLCVWDGTTWQWQDQTIEHPGLLYATATDALRGRIVGLSTDGFSEFDGAKWSAPVPDSARNRSGAAIAYDAARGNTVLFGGTDDGALDDTWTWDGSDWTEHQPTVRPAGRLRHSMVFDTKQHVVIMFGGMTCPTGCANTNETWAWDGADWALRAPAHLPPARSRAMFAYDPVHQQGVLFGGDGNDGPVLGDTWIWDGTDWSQHSQADGPEARRSATLAWDPARQRLVLFGGFDGTSYHSDVWEWDGGGWSQLAVIGSPTRANHALTANIGAGLVMYGGFKADGIPVADTRLLRWDGASPTESCRSDIDEDGDGLAGCADPDCWWACRPLCPPGAPCDATAPHCGDGVCNAALEDCRICPEDCQCASVCGDAICDLDETLMSCPGDCP